MTSFQVTQWLRQGIEAVKTGDAERARELLLQVVDADEYNEQAWIWLSSVVETDQDREICLENVLSINPDNNLAKSGLVHLRNRQKAATIPPVEPEPTLPPQPEPEPPDPTGGLKTMPADWWSQPESPEAEPEADDSLQARLSTTVAPAEVETTAESKEPKPKKKRRRIRIPLRPLAIAACLVLSLLSAGVAALAVLQASPFDPGDHDYTDVMRPLLDDHDDWWNSSYGALVGELNSLCGPGADGWRNRDVLLTCSQHPSIDCAHLAAHCGDDDTGIEAMRARIGKLSRQAQRTGASLLTELDAIVPPDDVAQAHGRFLACIQAQVDDAARAGQLARSELPADPGYVRACQMFPAAEEKVRAFVGNHQ